MRLCILHYIMNGKLDGNTIITKCVSPNRNGEQSHYSTMRGRDVYNTIWWFSDPQTGCVFSISPDYGSGVLWK